MVWGGISIKDLIGYRSFETIMDDFYYVQDHLISNARRQFGRRWRLLQDNYPKHKSWPAQKFLSSVVAGVIEWPSNSPHANPLENLWSIIKRCVEKRKLANLEELNKFLHEECVNIDVVVS